MNGEAEPIPSELTHFSEEEEVENDHPSAPAGKAGKGIPKFWLSVLKHQVRIWHPQSQKKIAKLTGLLESNHALLSTNSEIVFTK